MKVEVSMHLDDKLYVHGWFATSPEFVLSALRQQLEAAAAVWPELAQVRISTKSKAEARASGGRARAAALSPERRAEIASNAAKARWADV